MSVGRKDKVFVPFLTHAPGRFAEELYVFRTIAVRKVEILQDRL